MREIRDLQGDLHQIPLAASAELHAKAALLIIERKTVSYSTFVRAEMSSPLRIGYVPGTEFSFDSPACSIPLLPVVNFPS